MRALCVWMCGTEYGGGGGGERRWLDGNQLVGSIPPELGNLDSLTSLCVARPTASPCNVGSAAHPREARWVGEQVHGCCGLTPEERGLFVR